MRRHEKEVRRTLKKKLHIQRVRQIAHCQVDKEWNLIKFLVAHHVERNKITKPHFFLDSLWCAMLSLERACLCSFFLHRFYFVKNWSRESLSLARLAWLGCIWAHARPTPVSRLEHRPTTLHHRPAYYEVLSGVSTGEKWERKTERNESTEKFLLLTRPQAKPLRNEHSKMNRLWSWGQFLRKWDKLVLPSSFSFFGRHKPALSCCVYKRQPKPAMIAVKERYYVNRLLCRSTWLELVCAASKQQNWRAI